MSPSIAMESTLTHVAGLEPSGALALRTATAEAHRQVEGVLALPGSIVDGVDYRRWLARFLAIYSPLEERLAEFSDWPRWNIHLGAMGHTAGLRHDLLALGCDPDGIVRASAEMLPALKTFAEALGALYVLEGSKLGGRFILQDLTARMADEIVDAKDFFSGHGAESGSRWSAFKDSLDRYCVEHPEHLPAVIAGADGTFRAIGGWMAPLAQRGIQ